jgi:hypothetical protein
MTPPTLGMKLRRKARRPNTSARSTAREREYTLYSALLSFTRLYWRRPNTSARSTARDREYTLYSASIRFTQLYSALL